MQIQLFSCVKNMYPVEKKGDKALPSMKINCGLLFLLNVSFISDIFFQIQPFFDSDNSSHAQFSGDVWDCVPFFTIPIWMGIISTVLLMIILFFGLTMITNITTMDRFDDPKGKTITINVNE